jgi:hypothetical protein
VRGQGLEGDGAVQLLVEGAQDHAHAALADDLKHLVMADAPQVARLARGLRNASASASPPGG